MHFARIALLVAVFNCFFSCKPAFIQVRTTPDRLVVSTPPTRANSVDSFLMPLRDSLRTIMDVPICEALAPFVKERPGGSLGNMVCDAMLAAARSTDSSIVLAIGNYGGLRVNRWAEGSITVRNVYELMPFDNTLVVLNVPGAVLKQWFQHMALSGGWPVAGGCVQLDTLKQQYNLSNCISAKSVPIDTLATYRVVTSDYIARGGDRCNFLINQPFNDTGLLIREAILMYLKEKKSIHPDTQKRFTFQ